MIFVVQLLVLLKGAHTALSKKREKDDEEYMKWIEDGGKYVATSEQPPSLEEMNRPQDPSSEKVEAIDGPH